MSSLGKLKLARGGLVAFGGGQPQSGFKMNVGRLGRQVFERLLRNSRLLRVMFQLERATRKMQDYGRILQMQAATLLIVRERACVAALRKRDLAHVEMRYRIVGHNLQEPLEMAFGVRSASQRHLVYGEILQRRLEVGILA